MQSMNSLPDVASPLYERIKGYLLSRITSGVWPANHRLPSENDLVRDLGASRMTVNRALRELASDGFLTRIQGVGTFVAVPKARSGLLEINNIAGDILARGHSHRADVILLESIVAAAPLMKRFEFARRRTVFHSIVVHFEDDTAVQFEERFVNAQLVPAYDRQDFSTGTTYDYLMRSTPVTELEHLVSAIPADRPVATHLGIKIGEPCLLLRRRTWSGPVVATVSNLTYVGSRTLLGSRYAPSRISECHARPLQPKAGESDPDTAF